MSWTQAEMARIGQALAILDHFRPGTVLAILGRTKFHQRLKGDPAAVRAVLADEDRATFMRIRAAKYILLAAGLDDGDPMVPVIISWDWKAQPPMDSIAAAVARISGERRPVVMRMLDTGDDQYAMVIADRDVTDEEAGQAWDARTISLSDLERQ